jgi:hypothetical protein
MVNGNAGHALCDVRAVQRWAAQTIDVGSAQGARIAGVTDTRERADTVDTLRSARRRARRRRALCSTTARHSARQRTHTASECQGIQRKCMCGAERVCAAVLTIDVGLTARAGVSARALATERIDSVNARAAGECAWLRAALIDVRLTEATAAARPTRATE